MRRAGNFKDFRCNREEVSRRGRRGIGGEG